MSDELVHRAVLLLQQHKYKEAEKLLGGLMARDPSNIQVIRLMCETKIYQDQFDEAMQLVNHAIGIDPEDSWLFYQRARIFIHKDKYDDAEKDLQQAITLDPYDANFFAIYSILKNDRKQFSDALELADKALELDPENIQAMNARSRALLKLNRKDEAIDIIESALREDPHSAFTHTNYGWSLLEKGSPREALHHFSEALRINPNLELAQAGMAEALKARYILYNGFMKFSFWMGNLAAKNQWALIIGFYVSVRLLRSLGKNIPSFQPFIYPLLVILALIAFSTWIITPIGNLFLRLNKYGKHLLNRNQMVSANLVGLSAAVAITAVIIYFITSQIYWLGIAVYGITMMIPLSTMFSSFKKRKLFLTYTCLLAAFGILGITSWIATGEPFNIFCIIYMIGFIAFQWVANYFMIRESNL